MKKNLKNKLKNQELTIGSWITIGHPSIVEIMSEFEFDWLVIDLEHSSIDIQTTLTLISLIQSKGISALVRVSKNEEVIIKRVMDAGADGIIVPMINSYMDVCKAVEYVHYPPKGKRGVGLARAQKYGKGFNEYKEWLKENAVIIGQIEHKDAVDNIEDIVSKEGLDGVIIGPYDLSGSLNIPGELTHPDVLGAISKVKEVCRKYKMPLGDHVIEPNAENMISRIKDDYSFLAFSVDFLFLGHKLKDEFDLINQLK